MRLVGRILVVVAAAGGPAVVMLIGCNVDNSHNPGLQNELPNQVNTVPVVFHSDGAVSTGVSSSGAPAGPAMSRCDCAAAVNAGVPACKACEQTTCQSAYTACQASDCPQAIACVAGCSNGGPCIANCISMYPGYAAFMNCVFLMGCAPACGWNPPLSCPLSDGGTDASTDAPANG